MGQYYFIVNLDKEQYLDPHDFGDGLKLLEFGLSGCGAMAGLAILLAEGNGQGGGDLFTAHYADTLGRSFSDPAAKQEYAEIIKPENRDKVSPPVVGSWAGNRIVVAGDYMEDGKYLTGSPVDENGKPENLFFYAEKHFTNIGPLVIEALAEDSYVRDELLKRGAKGVPQVPASQARFGQGQAPAVAAPAAALPAAPSAPAPAAVPVDPVVEFSIRHDLRVGDLITSAGYPSPIPGKSPYWRIDSCYEWPTGNVVVRLKRATKDGRPFGKIQDVAGSVFDTYFLADPDGYKTGPAILKGIWTKYQIDHLALKNSGVTKAAPKPQAAASIPATAPVAPAVDPIAEFTARHGLAVGDIIEIEGWPRDIIGACPLRKIHSFALDRAGNVLVQILRATNKGRGVGDPEVVAGSVFDAYFLTDRAKRNGGPAIVKCSRAKATPAPQAAPQVAAPAPETPAPLALPVATNWY